MFLITDRGGIKYAVKSTQNPNSSNRTISASNSTTVNRISSPLEETQSNQTDDTYTLVKNESITKKSVDRNLSPTFVSPNPYRHLEVDDEINFEEVATVHVPTRKIIHDPTPGRKHTNSNSNIYCNNYPGKR